MGGCAVPYHNLRQQLFANRPDLQVAQIKGIDSLPLIRIPIIRLGPDSFPLIRRHQLLKIIHPHTPSYNFPHPRHQHIHALRHPQIRGVFLHVKRLDLDGEVRQEYRLVDNIRHLALRGLGNVVAEGVGLAFFVEDVVLPEPVDGVGVAHAHKGALGDLKGRVEVVDDFFGGGGGEGGGDDAGHDFLEVDEEVLEGDEVELGFNVGVLTQVPSGEGFLGAEGRGDAEDVS